MLKDFARAWIAVGLFAALCGAAGAQPAGPKKDEGSAQLKTFVVKNANLTEAQQYLVRYFTPAAPPPKPGTAPAAPKPTILVAVEPKTKTLFVRGPAAEVETAGKIIAQLDGSDARGPLNVLVLQYAPVDEAMKVLTSLDLAKSVSPLPQSRLLILPQDDPTADEVKTVLVRLEAAFKPEPKAPANAPFELQVAPTPVKVVQGTKVKIKVTVVRKGSYQGPITLDLQNLPANVTTAKVTIDSGKTEAEMELTAATGAAIAERDDVRVLGTALTAANQQASSRDFVVSVVKK
jgi:hypothetical protein